MILLEVSDICDLCHHVYDVGHDHDPGPDCGPYPGPEPYLGLDHEYFLGLRLF